MVSRAPFQPQPLCDSMNRHIKGFTSTDFFSKTFPKVNIFISRKKTLPLSDFPCEVPQWRRNWNASFVLVLSGTCCLATHLLNTTPPFSSWNAAVLPDNIRAPVSRRQSPGRVLLPSGSCSTLSHGMLAFSS